MAPEHFSHIWATSCLICSVKRLARFLTLPAGLIPSSLLPSHLLFLPLTCFSSAACEQRAWEVLRRALLKSFAMTTTTTPNLTNRPRTVLGSLTTTFTPPASCAYNVWVGNLDNPFTAWRGMVCEADQVNKSELVRRDSLPRGFLLIVFGSLQWYPQWHVGRPRHRAPSIRRSDLMVGGSTRRGRYARLDTRVLALQPPAEPRTGTCSSPCCQARLVR